MDANRRAFLGTAALGASGLVVLSQQASHRRNRTPLRRAAISEIASPSPLPDAL